MTTDEVRRINRDRLGRWAELMAAGHATALVLVAVGHDARSGQVEVCMPELGPTEAEIALILRRVADRLEGGS